MSLDTWLWIGQSGWQTQTTSSSERGVRVEVTAQPSHVVWRTGERFADGSEGSTTCKGPGKAWPKGSTAKSLETYCSYSYQSTSAGQPQQRYAISAPFPSVHPSCTTLRLSPGTMRVECWNIWRQM